MPHQAPLQPGDPRRVGRYRLAGRITGIPADGPIFLGSGPDGTEVTISVLHSEWTQDGAARDRFAAEAAVAKRVPPFCAARILDAGLDGGDAFLVSEHVPGPSLLEVVTGEGTLAGDELGRVAIGMATGLASVHLAGLVHGNFGPEYVIMTSTGPRVVEFGITPPYGAATPSADMLAWGQTVMFAAAGRPATAMADLEVLPGYVRELVLDCLDPDPAARPSARAAVLALIGEEEVPAGVLAEGSRRAAPDGEFMPPAASAGLAPVPAGGADHRQAARAGHHPAQHTSAGRATRTAGRPPAAGPGHGPGAGGHGHGPGAGQRQAAGTGRGPDRPPSAADSGPRQASRHSRTGAEVAPVRRSAAGGAGEHRPRRTGLRAGLVVTAAVVIIAVIVVVAVRMLGGHGSAPQPIGAKSTRGVSLQTPVTTPAASPAPVVTTPADFGGGWSGEVEQPPNDTYHVALTLHRGSQAGSVSYQTAGVKPFSCVLSLTAATRQKLTFSEGAQGNCTAGTVTLRLTGGSSAAYTFRGGGFVATGSLSRG